MVGKAEKLTYHAWRLAEKEGELGWVCKKKKEEEGRRLGPWKRKGTNPQPSEGGKEEKKQKKRKGRRGKVGPGKSKEKKLAR